MRRERRGCGGGRGIKEEEEEEVGGIRTDEEKAMEEMVMEGDVTTNASIPNYEHRTVASATSP